MVLLNVAATRGPVALWPGYKMQNFAPALTLRDIVVLKLYRSTLNLSVSEHLNLQFFVKFTIEHQNTEHRSLGQSHSSARQENHTINFAQPNNN